jgi:hypothetical protein
MAALYFISLNKDLSLNIYLLAYFIFSLSATITFWYYFTALLLPHFNKIKILVSISVLGLAINGLVFAYVSFTEDGKKEIQDIKEMIKKPLPSIKMQDKLKSERLPAYPEQTQTHSESETNAPQ